MPIAAELEQNEAAIVKELIDAQGKPVDVGGYYQPDPAKASQALRPSKTLNGILAKL
ncbi:MAG TPA: NADP-dependent isocitrate dehydrogenase [Polyangiaceae bacterium]|nr:NADP-dependent isocitrate dehydrogenase [Polyangiaceae bacterium]